MPMLKAFISGCIIGVVLGSLCFLTGIPISFPLGSVSTLLVPLVFSIVARKLIRVGGGGRRTVELPRFNMLDLELEFDNLIIPIGGGMNDAQNVHDVQVQKSIIDSIK